MHVSVLQLYAANATCAAVTCGAGAVVGNSSISIANLSVVQARAQCCVVSNIAALLIAVVHLQLDEKPDPSLCQGMLCASKLVQFGPVVQCQHSTQCSQTSKIALL